MRIAPQPGPQTQFLFSEAEIAIYGGSAGGGKTFGLLLDPMRHLFNPRFGGVIFRRSTVQVRNEGGLWDESLNVYIPLRGHPREANLEWTFPSGARMKFAHIEHEKTVFDWQGAQIPWIGFDELTHFSEKMFFYMLSRNRSSARTPGRIRATCNPDVDSWVRQFISWWINPDTGYAIPERSGILRWFVRINDSLMWGSSKQELIDKYGQEQIPKSVTFIPSSIYDNKILMRDDPGYLSNLMALSRVDRLRLLEGNWNIKVSAGSLFKREWFPMVDAVPGGWIQAIRYWDRAATQPHEGNRDPDWTRGLKLYSYPDGTYIIVDLKSARDTPGQIEKLVKNVASHDTSSVTVMSQQDPGSAGVSEAEHFVRLLAGFDVRVETLSKDKVTRAKPVSAQCEAGNIRVLRAPWNEEFFQEVENFPEGSHDDIVDVLSGAFNAVSHSLSTADAYYNGG